MIRITQLIDCMLRCDFAALRELLTASLQLCAKYICCGSALRLCGFARFINCGSAALRETTHRASSF